VIGLDDRVAFETGDALAMPFADDEFDGAYSMNVSMNIADKAALYREIRRVLKPGAWLVLSEIAKGVGGDIEYPTPWAATGGSSFLSTPDETRRALVAAGFDVVRLDSTRDKALAFGERSRAAVARGDKPPHRAVMLMHGELAPVMIANTTRALVDGRIVPIEVVARKRRT
jgi:SAM-dependent methyltransferase